MHLYYSLVACFDYIYTSQQELGGLGDFSPPPLPPSSPGQNQGELSAPKSVLRRLKES